MTNEQPEIIGPTKANTDKKQSEPEAAPPQTPQPISKSGVGNLILYVLGALLFVFLLVGVFFIYKQSTQKSETKLQPELAAPQQPIEEVSPSPATQEGDELTVPTVSEDTSLDTIEKELNSLEVATPDADLNSLDSEASQL